MDIRRRIQFTVAVAALGMVSGCGMALRLADSASTSGTIKGSGPTLQLGALTITLAAHIELSRPPDRTGVMMLKLTSSGGGWPQRVRLSQIGFRPQSANYYFTYINVNEQGHATRITSPNAFSPQIELVDNTMEIRFRVLRLVDKPYEVQVTLRDALGEISSLGLRDIEQR